jgi:hypothetical protein
MPNLDDARPRVNRALEHLKELQRHIEAYGKAEIQLISYHLEGNPPQAVFDAPYRSNPVDPIIRILAGEVVYNLRAALDYLVRDLVILDTGADPKGGTQLPIESDEKAFTARHDWRVPTKKGTRKTRYLEGLHESHIAAIERLQPKPGSDWLGILRELSDRDKHNELIKPWGLTKGRAQTISYPLGALSDLAGQRGIHTAYGDPPIDVYVDFNITHAVTLPDETPIMDVLQNLVLKTAETLRTFQPEFEIGKECGHSAPL